MRHGGPGGYYTSPFLLGEGDAIVAVKACVSPARFLDGLQFLTRNGAPAPGGFRTGGKRLSGRTKHH